MRIIGFDYLRGIAILMIVAGHALGTWQIDTIWEKTIVNLVSGGTVLFVFISGFFFHHIFYTQFRLTSFLSKKIQNVFLPYLLLSTLGFTYFALSSAPFPFLEYLLPEGIQNGQDYFTAYFSYLWTGRIMWAYWYIPFIMLIFILSPVFISYIKLPMIFRLSIMASLLLVSAFFIHRPVLGLSPIHSLLYFIPVYLLGINCSVNRLQFETLINGKLGILATLVVSLAILQSLYFDSSGSAYKETWFSLAEFDINLLQKVLMCFFLCWLASAT
jgi:fucose 4-O-acetylase-like acetyltransferase